MPGRRRAVAVRLTLARGGGAGRDRAVSAAGIGCGLTLRMAVARLASDDPLLRHKTTRRAIYDAARRSFPTTRPTRCCSNERGEICEGTITACLPMPETALAAYPCPRLRAAGGRSPPR